MIMRWLAEPWPVQRGMSEPVETGVLAIDVAPMPDSRDEDAGAFPIEDDSIVADPISKTRLRSVNDPFGKTQGGGSLQPVVDFPQDAALNLARQFQELGFRVLRERVRNHARRVFCLTVAAETRPDFREASSEARNSGVRASRSSSISSRVFLSITRPRVWPFASTNRVMP